MQILTQGGRLASPQPLAMPAAIPHRAILQEINVVRRERRGYARAFPFEVAENETLEEFVARLKSKIGAGTLKSLLRKVFTCQEEAIFEASALSVSE